MSVISSMLENIRLSILLIEQEVLRKHQITINDIKDYSFLI